MNTHAFALIGYPPVQPPSNVRIMKLLVMFIIGSLTAGEAMAAEPIGPALNPAVTQATITETICTAGWTRTVRPYVADMKRIKAEMLAGVGEPIERRNRYELDHVVPLALGGALTACFIYINAGDNIDSLRYQAVREPSGPAKKIDASNISHLIFAPASRSDALMKSACRGILCIHLLP
jgi:hypothetical protein